MPLPPTRAATLYKALQVDHEAELAIIQAAYRKLAQRYHPDHDPSPEAVREMAALNAAFDILRDPERREAYDRDLARRRTRRAADRKGSTGDRGLGARMNGAAGGAAEPAEHAAGGGEPARGGDAHRYPGPSPAYAAGRAAGAAGPPPTGPATGTVLDFGRYAGWSLGQIARVDPAFLEWLSRAPVGRAYRAEIVALLAAAAAPARPPVTPASGGRFFRR